MSFMLGLCAFIGALWLAKRILLFTLIILLTIHNGKKKANA